MRKPEIKVQDVTDFRGLFGINTFEAIVYDKKNDRYIWARGGSREQAVENLLEKLVRAYQVE